MDDKDEYAIPAASIGHTDLDAVADTNPVAAKEISRLEDLVNRGEDIPGWACYKLVTQSAGQSGRIGDLPA